MDAGYVQSANQIEYISFGATEGPGMAIFGDMEDSHKANA
jgi:hypothetical protein